MNNLHWKNAKTPPPHTHTHTINVYLGIVVSSDFKQENCQVFKLKVEPGGYFRLEIIGYEREQNELKPQSPAPTKHQPHLSASSSEQGFWWGGAASFGFFAE